MNDPTRLTELAPRLKDALDDAALDPPAGAEDLIWARLESALEAEPSARDDDEERARPEPSVRIAVTDSSEPARARSERTSNALKRRRRAPFEAVAGALAIAAAVALFVGRSNETELSARADPSIVGTVAPGASPVTSAISAPAPVTTAASPSSPSRGPERADAPPPSSPSEPFDELSPRTAASSTPLVELPPPPAEAERGKVARQGAPIYPTDDVYGPPFHPSAPLHPPQDAYGRAVVSADASAALARARELVVAGNGAEALAQLERLRNAPLGVLGEERDALRVEALVLAGMIDTARGAFASFSEAYPRSVHRERLRKMTSVIAP